MLITNINPIELQRKLMEAQGKYNSNNDKIRPYTASVRCQKDIESLSKIGLNTQEISYTLDLPFSLIRSQQARIARASEDRRRFLRTGILPQFEVPWTTSSFHNLPLGKERECEPFYIVKVSR